MNDDLGGLKPQAIEINEHGWSSALRVPESW
jgi:hypothetical protein